MERGRGMKRLILSADADLDLVEIYFYSARKWGREQANKYLVKIQRDLDRLARGDAAGKSSEALFPDFPSPLKLFLTGRHYIIYRETAKTLDIANIVHAARYQAISELLDSF
jgi:toxin ParE1/3/4